MAKTLILNIDRDDDFGRKAKVKSPIIGVKDNLDAAIKLGRIDPEDSDLNAIFFAISAYDKLIKEGKDVEIATICGDIHVGIRSDQLVSEQLEMVMQQTNATEAIVLSDGAEDEYILPIIQSRLKIVSVQRVNVKQSKQLEDTYYRVIKLLDDDKVKKQFLLPVALIFLVGAIFTILDMSSSGFGAIIFTLGVYLLIRVFNWERSVSLFLHEMKSGILTGKLSFYTYLISLVIISVSIFYAFNNTNFNKELLWVVPILDFLNSIVWGIVAAALLASFGRVTDLYVREKIVNWSYWIVPFSLFAFGFISSAIFQALYYSVINNISLEPFFTPHFIGYVSAGMLIAFIGAVTYHYIKEIYIDDEQRKEELDEQTNLVRDA
jgi:putative membrane protein